MSAESFMQRIASARKLGRIMFYFRLLVLLAILLTIVVAVSPIPILAYFGIIQLEALFGK